MTLAGGFDVALPLEIREVAVENQPDTVNRLFFIEAVDRRFAGRERCAVLAVVPVAIPAVAQDFAAGLRPERQIRNFPLRVRDELILIEQCLAQLLDVMLPDAPRHLAGAERDRGGGPHRLPHHRGGRHHPGRTHRHVRGRNLPPGEEKIVDVHRIERTEGDAEGRRSRMVDRRRSRIVDRFRMVIVHRPAAVADRIGEVAARFHLFLRKNMVTDEPDALALARQRTDPVELPLFPAPVGMIFDILPDTVGDPVEFVADLLGVGDGVAHPAELHPPEVVSFRHQVPLRRGLIGVVIGPLRGPERAVGLRPPQLDQNRIAHRLFVGVFRRMRLVELIPRLAPHPVLRAGKAQDAVAGTIGKEFPLHPVAGVFDQVPRGDRTDFPIFDFDRLHRGVEQHREVRLLADEVVHHIVPYRVVQFRIEIEVVQLKLLQQPGLFSVRPVGSADPHPDLARRVAAEHRPILNNQRFRSIPRRGHGGAQSGHSSSNHHEVRFCVLFPNHHRSASQILQFRHSQYPQCRSFSSHKFEITAFFYIFSAI